MRMSHLIRASGPNLTSCSFSRQLATYKWLYSLLQHRARNICSAFAVLPRATSVFHAAVVLGGDCTW